MAKTFKKPGRVAVGMSGGVDSSVAAALLQQQGYDCFGIFMHYWSDPTGIESRLPENQCCSVPNYEDVRRVCAKLGIELYTLNFDDLFKTKVVDYFLDEYAAGRTPNPCIECNKHVKFGAFWAKAHQLGADYLATGHYVRQKNNGGRSRLFVAADDKKDQSYFLYGLKPEVLAHTLFPIGKYTKPQVRRIAARFGLATAQKAESVDVCFVKETHHNDFLTRHLKMKPGKIISTAGAIIGDHIGLPLYTIGQRRGINLPGGPWYVCGSDQAKNELIVTNHPDDPKLSQSTIVMSGVNWLSGVAPKLPYRCAVRVRYHSASIPTIVTKQVADEYEIIFDTPQRAVTPGQSVVIYRRHWFGPEELIGGGVINRAQ